MLEWSTIKAMRVQNATEKLDLSAPVCLHEINFGPLLLILSKLYFGARVRPQTQLITTTNFMKLY